MPPSFLSFSAQFEGGCCFDMLSSAHHIVMSQTLRHCGTNSALPKQPASASTGGTVHALPDVQERYLPCNVYWYFEKCKLVSVEKAGNDVHVRELLSVEETTAERVARAPP